MKLENLGEMNKLYSLNYTDVWTTFSSSWKNIKFNQKKCNSASSFNSCVHRDKSKCLIALPTVTEHIKLKKKL